MDEYTGMIRIFAGTFAPRGWVFCDGTLYPIRQYTALFAILGNQFGGDGKVTFAVPDLRGRIVVGAGQLYVPGETGGVATNALNSSNLPLHAHPVASNFVMNCNLDGSEGPNPVGNTYSISETSMFAPAGGGGVMVPPIVNGSDYTVGSTGVGEAYDNRMPYVGLNYVVCIEGNFPPRN